MPPKAKAKKQRVRRRAVTIAKVRRPPKSKLTAGKRVRCPIVGIGGSAGGFEAAMELLRHLSPSTGMAFVIVQHLDPHHTSRLPKLLCKATAMPVIELAQPVTPRPNTIYVQPPNKSVIVKDGTLQLIPRTEKLNLAIDNFFESLAEEFGSRAIGVILSGSGTDGTRGVRAIKAAGGLTFAQSEESAKFNSMPRSAIRAGFVDVALPPREIAKEIRRVSKHPYVQRTMADGEGMKTTKGIDSNADDLRHIFFSLRKQMGVDFSNYKEATLLRRIHRRMAVHRMEKIGQYANFLRDNNHEIKALFADLLINVTHFFRDERMFRELKKRFLPALLKSKEEDQSKTLRVWVPGCATGEEVYSLAICILETLRRRDLNMDIQIFGTDLSESAIEHARAGVYAGAIEKDVSRSRLKRFFVRRDGNYQIDRNVRDICTFARQSVTDDPPLSRLDLISCRNVLIYLSPQLHKRCIPQFHYALNPGGYLILGPAESVGFYNKLFEPVDRKNSIYAKRKVPAPRLVDLASHRGYEFPETEGSSTASDRTDLDRQLLETVDRIMVSAYAPAAVVIDEALQIEQFRGRTNDYLEQMPGRATHNLLQLVRPSIVADLRVVIDRAAKTGKPTRKERVLIKHDGKTREVNLEIVPFKLPASNKLWLLVIFDETTKGAQPGRLLEILGKTAAQREITQVRRELSESQSAGEELLSRNEELQVINEELETAKEELQSTNEELITLNDELSNRNLEMMQLTSDLDNLLTSVQIPIVMVDRELIVRRATPAARSAFNILPTDIGRRITELRPNIDVPDLENILRDVTRTSSIRERKVKGPDGREYSLRVRAYRARDNKINGAVITLIELGAGESGAMPLNPPTARSKSSRTSKKRARVDSQKSRHRLSEPCAN